MQLKISRKAQKILILPGILAPIFYFTLLTILGLMWDGYNPISTGMSEIGAIDSPFKDIMNYLGFSLLGISIVVFSFGVKVFFRKNLTVLFVFILLLIGGIVMFSVGFFPCDSQCIDVTTTGELHSLTSLISAILIPIAAMLFAYPISNIWGKRWGYGSFFLGILSMASGPIMFIEYFSTYTGLIQRVGIGFSLFWIFITSLKILKETRP